MHETFETGLTDAARRYSSGDARGARYELEEIIRQVDPSGDAYRDDAVSEYRSFQNPYQEVLYKRLFQPTREVRTLPYDLAGLYLLYGTTLVELHETDAAEYALLRAQRFSPIEPAVLFELSEVYKLQRRWAEYHELSTFALAVCFREPDAARAYRNLGFFFIEQRSFDVAAACYQMSASIDEASLPRCTHELKFITQQTGAPMKRIDPLAAANALWNNGIQVGMSRISHEAIAEIDQDDGIEDKIFATVRDNFLTQNMSEGEPRQLAALLLWCAGPYRNHPETHEILLQIAWGLSEDSTPDLRAKICLAITRLANPEASGAQGEADGSGGFAFINDLYLWTTHSGPEGTVAVTHKETGKTVVEYNFATAALSLNRELLAEGSNFPIGVTGDAMWLVMTYAGRVTSQGKEQGS